MIFSWGRRLRRCLPTVVGAFGTGIPRLWDGKYFRSQKGNVEATNLHKHWPTFTPNEKRQIIESPTEKITQRPQIKKILAFSTK